MQSQLNSRMDQMNAQLNGRMDQMNGRIDRLFLAIPGIGAAQIGLLITLIVTLILRS